MSNNILNYLALELLVKEAVEEVVEKIKEESLAEVPKDSGDLADSIYSKVEFQNGQINYEIGYTSEYATKQHEDLSLNHPNGGKAKFLEDPLTRNEALLNKIISDKLGGVL